MSRLKKICALFLSVCCVTSLCACGKTQAGGSSTAMEPSFFFDVISEEVKNGDGVALDLLHGCFEGIYTSSATSNAFLTKVSSTGDVEYALNGKTLSHDQFTNIENGMKLLSAGDFNAFELLAYASYLDETGNKFGTNLAPKSQSKLFEYMKGVYDGTETEINFNNAIYDAKSVYYATLNVDSLSHISFDINGDYLHIKTNALMPGLFSFEEGETLVGCYETRQGFVVIPYTSEDGGTAEIEAKSSVGILLGSKGTAIGYEYISVGSDKEFVLRDIYYLVGGGCVNGELPEEERPEVVSPADRLFFQERSLGSFAEMECYLVFNKLVKDFNVTNTAMSYAIENDIGIKLLSSAGVYTGGLLQANGFLPDEAEVNRSAVGRIPYGEDDTYGDLYGWYELSVPDMRRSADCIVEGFAVLHSRDYGFSAENYVRIF